jgi:hypothetical protein
VMGESVGAVVGVSVVDDESVGAPELLPVLFPEVSPELSPELSVRETAKDVGGLEGNDRTSDCYLGLSLTVKAETMI